MLVSKVCLIAYGNPFVNIYSKAGSGQCLLSFEFHKNVFLIVCLPILYACLFPLLTTFIRGI